MFKQVSLMRRNPSLTPEEFRHLYETRHARFGEVLFRKARRMVRRYVVAESNPLTGEAHDPGFDAILEIWWDNREDYAEAMAGLAGSGLIDEVRRSGAELFASPDIAAFSVDECDSPVSSPLEYGARGEP